MEIREATESDIPEIISVLKASLGESKLQKSERIWKFKHLENPFGPSLVLLAIEDGAVIGIRAFMRWKWQLGRQAYSAFRAVDTATHPAHQGKGVFKKLTLKAIDIAVERGDHLIFNTPNSQSLPGYLKMGWKEIGKLNVRLVPVNPLKWIFGKDEMEYQTRKGSSEKDIRNLSTRHNAMYSERNRLFTPKSADYLRWRYEENPLQEYEVITGHGFYLAAYVKEHKRFRELRIVEHLFNSREDFRKLKGQVKVLSRKFGVQLISYGEIGSKISPLSVSGKFGPVLTFRNLTLESDLQERCLSLDNWSYSLGDLELF